MSTAPAPVVRRARRQELAARAAARAARRRRRSRLGVGLFATIALVLAAWATGSTPASADSTFTFTGGGWGHGVGMSQWGARGWAEQGSSAGQILTHYYSGTAVTSTATTNDIRVLLGTASSFTLQPGTNATFGGIGVTSGAVTVSRSGGSVVVGGALSGSVGTLVVSFGGAPMRVSPPGYTYLRGTLVIVPDGASGLRAVLSGLSMQEYLYGLGEMPSSWPAAALQAQAIAARTYAQKKVNAAAGGGTYDIVGGLPDQSYLGWDKEGGTMGDRWKAAVDATAGQVVTYGGALIDAVYSASSGGHTENSENVWVSALPYLRGVPDPFDGTGGNPNGAWSRSWSGSQLGSWFGVGELTSIQVLGGVGVSGRVDKATIRLIGTAGSKDVLGAAFRTWLNAASPSYQLPSTKFSVGGPAAPPPVSSPGNTMPFGVIDIARAERKVIVVAGYALDPEGAPRVRIVSTMGSQVATREVQTVDGSWAAMWSGSDGTRRICVTLLDTPTAQAVPLGCRDVTVK